MQEMDLLEPESILFLNKFRPWSYSKSNKLNTCPFSFYKQYAPRERPRPLYPNKNTNWNSIHGSIMHEFLECVMKGELELHQYYLFVNKKDIPESIKHRVLMHYDSLVQIYKKIHGVIKSSLRSNSKKKIQLVPEYSISLNADLRKEMEYQKILFKSIIDIFALRDEKITIIDYKSKLSASHTYDKQLEFYAVMAKCRFPDTKQVSTYLVDLKQGKIVPVHCWNANMLEQKKREFVMSINKICSDYQSCNETTFPPKKNKYCKYCDLQSECPLY